MWNTYMYWNICYNNGSEWDEDDNGQDKDNYNNDDYSHDNVGWW